VFGAWNIASHTVANLLWISAAFLAAGIARLLFDRLDPKPLVLMALTAILAVACAYGAMGFVTIYGEWWHRASRQFYTLVTRLDRSTPAGAVVVQEYDTEEIMWVSGFGGRLTPLERASLTRPRYPEEVYRREQLIADLYAAPTAEDARDIAKLLGADFAIVDRRDNGAILEAGPVVDTQGNWDVIDLRGSAESSATP
jgi:hypothetical protein